MLKSLQKRGYCKIFKNCSFYRIPPVAASGYSNQSKIFQDIIASEFKGQHAAQVNFCRYEGEIHRGCFPQNFANICLEQLFSRIILRAASEKEVEKEKNVQ